MSVVTWRHVAGVTRICILLRTSNFETVCWRLKTQQAPSDAVAMSAGPQFLELELEKLHGFKVTVKTRCPIFSRRNVHMTDFHFSKCELKHEVKANISAANAFLRRPYLPSERVISIGLSFSELRLSP